jgi:hypothetical protein
MGRFSFPDINSFEVGWLTIKRIQVQLRPLPCPTTITDPAPNQYNIRHEYINDNKYIITYSRADAGLHPLKLSLYESMYHKVFASHWSKQQVNTTPLINLPCTTTGVVPQMVKPFINIATPN